MSAKLEELKIKVKIYKEALQVVALGTAVLRFNHTHFEHTWQRTALTIAWIQAVSAENLIKIEQEKAAAHAVKALDALGFIIPGVEIFFQEMLGEKLPNHKPTTENLKRIRTLAYELDNKYLGKYDPLDVNSPMGVARIKPGQGGGMWVAKALDGSIQDLDTVCIFAEASRFQVDEIVAGRLGFMKWLTEKEEEFFVGSIRAYIGFGRFYDCMEEPNELCIDEDTPGDDEGVTVDELIEGGRILLRKIRDDAAPDMIQKIMLWQARQELLKLSR